MLFLEHYGLIEQPFGVTPDARFLYLGPKHREALDPRLVRSGQTIVIPPVQKLAASNLPASNQGFESESVAVGKQ